MKRLGAGGTSCQILINRVQQVMNIGDNSLLIFLESIEMDSWAAEEIRQGTKVNEMNKYRHKYIYIWLH